MQGAWRRWEGRGQRIIERAEKGSPRGPHTGRTGLGRGGYELRNAESIQPSSQEADPPIPALSISPRGRPQQVSVTRLQRQLPSPGILSHGTSVCLSMHPSLPTLRSRQEAQPNSLPSLCLFLKFPEMDNGMPATGTASLGVGCMDLDFLPPTPRPPQGPQQGRLGQTAWGCTAPPRQGWDIKAGSAGACQPGL